jgi:hypothetical protein
VDRDRLGIFSHPRNPLQDQAVPQANLRPEADSLAKTLRQGYALLGLLPQTLDIERILAKVLTRRSQFDAGVAAFEQHPAEAVLHRLDPGADGGLRDIEIFGRAVEIATVRDFQKGANMIDFHARAPPAELIGFLDNTNHKNSLFK